MNINNPVTSGNELSSSLDKMYTDYCHRVLRNAIKKEVTLGRKKRRKMKVYRGQE